MSSRCVSASSSSTLRKCMSSRLLSNVMRPSLLNSSLSTSSLSLPSSSSFSTPSSITLPSPTCSHAFSTSTQTTKTFTAIPVIDLSSTFPRPGVTPEQLKANRLAVAREIDQAAREVGFITIKGHGVPADLISRMQQVTEKYFDLSEEKKNEIIMDKDYPYGYSGFGGESLYKGYSNAVAQPDPKESFCIGPNNPAAGMPAIKWPSQPKEFTPVWTEYYQNMENLAAHILSIFALALNLPENWFADKITRHRSALRALNYPALPKPLPAGQVRAGAHTDYGSITILLQDAVGGLQVKNRNDEWVDATPMSGAYVINLGDLMARWTNDRWVSTLHRVVQPPQAVNLPPKRRQSIAFFHNINPDFLVEAIPTCTSKDNPPKYEPIKAWDLLIQKHSASTNY